MYDEKTHRNTRTPAHSDIPTDTATSTHTHTPTHEKQSHVKIGEQMIDENKGAVRRKCDTEV